MAFTEHVIDRTKRIEKRLKELGASGVGLHELASSVGHLISDPVRLKLRYIITVRNKVVHELDYVFDDDESRFIATCDEVLAHLSKTRPAPEPEPARRQLQPPSSISTGQHQPSFHATGKPGRRRPSGKHLKRAFAALVLLIAVAAGMHFRARIGQEAGMAWQSVTASLQTLRENPVKQKSAPEPPHFTSVAEAQKAAMQKYPALKIQGSEFNRKFLALHARYKKERPSLFQDTNWPMLIADEVAAPK